MLLPFWLWIRDKAALPKRSERLWIMLSGAFLGLHFTFWISSLYYTSVASASVLVTVHPILMILIERFWFKRSFKFTTWFGVFIAFIGSLTLGISDSQIEQSFADPLFGNFLALSAAVIFVFYLLIGQKIRQRRKWVDYVFPVYFYAAVVCILLALLFGENLLDISTRGILVGAGLAFGPQIMGHGSMNYAVKFVSPTLLSTLILAEPLLASVLAFFLFAEMPPIGSIAGMLLILSGVALTWRGRSKSS
jgi:drug/metabolite transporter (DMT)-like permease